MANEKKKKTNQVKKYADEAEKKMQKARKDAEREIKKVKMQMDKSVKKVESYVKQNPEKASLISAGIGAALGASLAMLMKAKKGKKKK